MTRASTLLQLPTRHLGREIHVYGTLESTNSHALALADDPSHAGLAILARSQSAGRGQYGRTWSAPPGSSVLLSVLLFPPPALRRPVVLTAWAAVAVCEVVHELTGAQATIKWPNDVLVQARKICGILIEQRTTSDPDHSLATVVGIGLNVTQSAADFAAANLPEATSLLGVSGQPLDAEKVARQLLIRLDADYDTLHRGDLAMLESLWQWRLGLLGKPVRAECVDGVRRGRLVELGFGGVALDDDGQPILLTPESVKRLEADSRYGTCV
jgi:BirA family biotin operon repressor/biotin-[acetyl-CoA-carboxylase] ligase